MERFTMDSLDNLKEMELEKRYNLMEVTMKENGSKIKNKESFVKNLIPTKTNFIQVPIMKIKNQVKENYLIPNYNRYSKESFQIIKKKESSKLFKKMEKFLNLIVDKTICKVLKNILGNYLKQR